MSNNQNLMTRKHRNAQKIALVLFFVVITSSVIILLREFERDDARVPTYLHPHDHDGSLLDKLEDVEEVVYRRLDPYLHDSRIEKLREPIQFRWGKRDDDDDDAR